MSPSTEDRAQDAHRAAFALITGVLTNPDEFAPEGSIAQVVTESDDSLQALLDLAQVLVWHAAGAILTHSDSRDDALALVQTAALQQEAHDQEGHDE